MRTIVVTALVLFSTCLIMAGDEDRYASVDRHALDTPSSATKSINALSTYLTKPFDRNEEKARAVFRWITKNISYDVEGYFSGRTSSDCNNVLESRSSVCGGYSNLFEALCRKAGLEVVTIGGYGKGFDYHAGDKVADDQNHAWNAVKIRGKWRLIDCTWGAGKVDKEHKYIEEFEPYYFMTEPEEFIYRHFPKEKKWQLLRKPVSRQEFENLLLVSPVYFQCGLKLIGKQSTVIDVTNEYISEISAPKNILVTSTLEQNDKVAEDAVFLQRFESNIKVRLMPPATGEYFLHIFAKRGKGVEKIPLALSFKIIAHVDIEETRSFPQIFKTYLETYAQLQEPLTKELPSGSVQKFSIISPGAQKVAVVCGDEWDFLKKKGDRYEGTAEISSGKVTVLAQYPGKKEFEALVEYNGTGDFQRAPGPIKYSKFMESGAELLSPLKKDLQAGTKQMFRIRLPGAIKTAVVIEEEWYYLEKKGNIFEGDINIRKGKIVVLGAYKDTRDFDGLLEYEGK